MPLIFSKSFKFISFEWKSNILLLQVYIYLQLNYSKWNENIVNIQGVEAKYEIILKRFLNLIIPIKKCDKSKFSWLALGFSIKFSPTGVSKKKKKKKRKKKRQRIYPWLRAETKEKWISEITRVSLWHPWSADLNPLDYVLENKTNITQLDKLSCLVWSDHEFFS